MKGNADVTPMCIHSKARDHIQMGYKNLRMPSNINSAGAKLCKSKSSANEMYLFPLQHPRSLMLTLRGEGVWTHTGFRFSDPVPVMKPKTCQVSCGLQFPHGSFKVLVLRYLVFRSTFHETTNSAPQSRLNEALVTSKISLKALLFLLLLLAHRRLITTESCWNRFQGERGHEGSSLAVSHHSSMQENSSWKLHDPSAEITQPMEAEKWGGTKQI